MIRDMRETDKSWLAALIDGEGCLSIDKRKRTKVYSYTAIITVGQLDKQMVEYALKITKTGTLHLQRGKVWRWQAKSRQANNIVEVILPYLLIKKRQALTILALCENSKKSKPTAEDYAYREKLYMLNKQLNQRSYNE